MSRTFTSGPEGLDQTAEKRTQMFLISRPHPTCPSALQQSVGVRSSARSVLSDSKQGFLCQE